MVQNSNDLWGISWLLPFIQTERNEVQSLFYKEKNITNVVYGDGKFGNFFLLFSKQCQRSLILLVCFFLFEWYGHSHTYASQELCCTSRCNQLDFKNVLMILAGYNIIFVLLNLLKKMTVIIVGHGMVLAHSHGSSYVFWNKQQVSIFLKQVPNTFIFPAVCSNKYSNRIV